MRLRFIILFCVFFPLMTGWGHWGPQVKVGFAVDNAETRETLIKSFTEELADNRGDLLLRDAKGDPAVQESQVKDLIAQGIQALVVIPADPAKAAPLVEAAHKAGIKVIALEQIIPNSQLDYLVTFDHHKAGRLEAEAILKKVPKGLYVLLEGDPGDSYFGEVWMGQREALKQPMERGDVSISQVVKKMSGNEMNVIKEFLKENIKFNAVLSPDDEWAQEAAQLVEKAGLSGKVLVAGIGESLEACRGISSGSQTLTLYGSPVKLAKEAAYLTAKVARKATQFDCQFTDLADGAVDNKIYFTKAVLLTPQVVEAKNLDSTVIRDGVEKKEDIYGK